MTATDFGSRLAAARVVRVWAQAFFAMPAALSMMVRSMARRAEGPLTGG